MSWEPETKAVKWNLAVTNLIIFTYIFMFYIYRQMYVLCRLEM